MKIRNLFICINIILFLNIFSINNLFAHEGAIGLVKERMDRFKTSKKLMRNINKGLQNENFKIIEDSAHKLLIWSKEMSSFFPKDSDMSPSEASSDIWLDPQGFEKAIKNFELASLELITQSKTTDLEKTVNAFRNLAGTCKGCHQKFRN